MAAPSRSAAASEAPPPARLSLNKNPFGPAPAVRRVLDAALGQVGRYGDEDAAGRLVTQIAALASIDARQIVMGEILDVLGLFLAAQTPTGGRFVYSLPAIRRSACLTRTGHNVAVFCTLDKIYGLAGLPVGYLLAP